MLPFLFTLLGVAHPLPARTSFNETARRNRRPQVRIAPEERAMLRTWGSDDAGSKRRTWVLGGTRYRSDMIRHGESKLPDVDTQNPQKHDEHIASLYQDKPQVATKSSLWLAVRVGMVGELP